MATRNRASRSSAHSCVTAHSIFFLRVRIHDTLRNLRVLEHHPKHARTPITPRSSTASQNSQAKAPAQTHHTAPPPFTPSTPHQHPTRPCLAHPPRLNDFVRERSLLQHTHQHAHTARIRDCNRSTERDETLQLSIAHATNAAAATSSLAHDRCSQPGPCVGTCGQ